MKFTISSDAKDFHATFSKFIEVTRWSPQKAIKFQGRLLFRKVIDFTPPNNRAQGRKAVKRDVNRAITAIKAAMFESKSIRKAIRERDYPALQNIFKNTKGPLQNAQVVPFKPSLVEEQRNRRGIVPFSRHIKYATADGNEVTAYIRKKQDNVGMARGGWSKAVAALGGSVPAWFARWMKAGQFTDRSDSPIAPFIEQKNSSPWTGRNDEDRVIANAIESRRVSMITDIETRIKKAAEKARLKTA